MTRVRYTPEQIQRTLEVYAEHGSIVAGTWVGCRNSTVLVWAARWRAPKHANGWRPPRPNAYCGCPLCEGCDDFRVWEAKPNPPPPAVRRSPRKPMIDTEWFDDAACRGKGTDLWFTVPGRSVAEGRLICEGCPVREKCLRYAMSNYIDHGMWGGLSENQRRALRRKRRAA